MEGFITEINDKLSKSPNLLNTHPYSQGWYAKLKVDPTNGIQYLSK
jgi:glycine cleavage system H lipoate-binding protein